MSERISVPRLIALRVGWYATSILVPTLALAWAGRRPERWLWLGWWVACFAVVSSPLSRAGRWLLVGGLTALAAATRWLVLGSLAVACAGLCGTGAAAP